MYDRILVALDGSETSHRALDHSIRLASDQHAKLRLLHVVDELGLNLGETVTPDAFWDAARRAGERIVGDAITQASNAGIDSETQLLELRSFGALYGTSPI